MFSDANTPPGGHWVAIALGSNLDDPAAMLGRAREALDRLDGLEVLACSSLYASAPWGDTDQPEFRNAVLIGRTRLDPPNLLAAMRAIEDRLGKRPVRKWGPRAIDLDLLLHGSDTRSQTPDLTLPHPHIRSRPFVVLPLAEAAAGLDVPPSWQPFLELDAAGRALVGETQCLASRDCWPCRAVPATIEVETSAPEQTRALGQALGRVARPPLIFALSGPLGAGKTCLTHGLAHGLGHAGPVPSPSYLLCNEYQTPRGLFQHWDFYRLEDLDDIESTAFPERLLEPAVFAIEWAGRFGDLLPPDITVSILLQPVGGTRRVRLDFPPGTLALRAALFAWSHARPDACPRP
ncbi:MAG: 2-amino-4-hydroxy-6-hydroxymethyldihydropteridine diphosphokinase [Candidatus Sumerlaeia bacterium]|nr:2-amino-4-hydroxy-6-hydroxymethyldihydropteridine diphosphokinase [Candidatus Sumerlaeia bacterium]